MAISLNARNSWLHCRSLALSVLSAIFFLGSANAQHLESAGGDEAVAYEDLHQDIRMLEGLDGSWHQAMVIPAVPQIEFAEGDFTMLDETLVYQIGTTDHRIVIPEGFVHDYASVPRMFWMLFPKHGRYGKAAIVHDYLYWAQPCKKEQADVLFWIGMKESGVRWIDRTSLYQSVSGGGQEAFDENARRRKSGEVRVVPRAFRPIPDDVDWPTYARRLRASGVKDPPFEPDSGFCALGDARVVPTAPEVDVGAR